MSRRSGAGGKPAKSQRRKTAILKRRNAPKATRDRGASIAGQETVVARLTHERDEALLRETANSEILHLISRSPGDLELVFRSILEDATRICNANFSLIPLAPPTGSVCFISLFTREGFPNGPAGCCTKTYTHRTIC